MRYAVVLERTIADCERRRSELQADWVEMGVPTGAVAMRWRDTTAAGSTYGLGCSSNGSVAACSFGGTGLAGPFLKAYDADGTVLWTAGDGLNSNAYTSAPMVAADGGVIAADNRVVTRFGPSGNVIWSVAHAGGAPVSPTVTENGVVVLENQILPIEHRGRRFFVVGLADELTREQRVDETLARLPPGEPALVVVHEPDVFPRIDQRASLTVAGHTHCGQVNLPLIGRLAVSEGAARWPCGLYEEDGRHLYVTGGIGVSMLPVRFRAPPEIVVLTLSGTSPAEASPLVAAAAP